MSDEPIELNDNVADQIGDRPSQASVRGEIDAQPRFARAAGGRFAPGHSGNRRGRPRKPPEATQAMMTRVLSEVVSLTLGGKRVEMSCAEAIFRSMCHNAMTDPRVAREVLRLAATREVVVDPSELDVRLEQSEAAFQNHLARVRRQILAEISAANAGDNDNPEPAFSPGRAP